VMLIWVEGWDGVGEDGGGEEEEGY
jgi:hypothetical protein